MADRTEEDCFLDAICEEPESDEPRLIFADWLEERGDPRGELMRCQVQIESLPPEDRQRVILKRQADQILRRHHKEWLGFQPTIPKLEPNRMTLKYRRGMASLSGAFSLFVTEWLPNCQILNWVDALSLHGGNNKNRKRVGPQVFEPFSHLLSLTIGLYPEADWSAVLREATSLHYLRSLSLGSGHLTTSGVKELAETEHFSRLEELRISSCHLGDEAIFALADSSCLTQLRVLDIRYNGLTDAAVLRLARSESMSNLEELFIRDPEITSNGALVLILSPTISRLKFLMFPEAQLGADVARDLAEAPQMAQLEILDFDGNQIGDPGAIALAQSPYLRKLRNLDLRRNGITDAAVPAIVESDNFRHLEAFYFYDNPVSYQGLERLREKFGSVLYFN